MLLMVDSVDSVRTPVKLTSPSRPAFRIRQWILDLQSVTSLEEFMRLHGEERHQLAMRRLAGEPLTERERRRLEALDAQLDRLLPRRPPRKDLDDTLASARRLISLYGTPRPR